MAKHIAIDYEKVKEQLEAIPFPKHRGIFFTMYGSGARSVELARVKKEDIVLNGKWLLIKLWTAKHRQHPIRTIPINTDKEYWLAQEILNFKTKFENDSDKLFMLAFSEQSTTRYYRRLCNKYFGTSPHSLRHSRLTHWKIKYGFDSLDLKQLAGWTNTMPATTYVHMDWTNIINKLE
jgi:integrase